MKKINLVVLFLEYKNNKYKNSYEILKLLLKDLYEKTNTTMIKIDNKNNHYDCCELIGNEEIVINGDNNEWEFSGWTKGIKYLKSTKIEYDAVLFVNDSFLNNDYRMNENLLDYKLLEFCINNNAVVGKIDALNWEPQYWNSSYLIENHDVKQWIRTNVFWIPKNIVNNIDSMVYYKKEDLKRFVPEYYKNTEQIFLINADMTRNLQRQMIAYIQKHWHSKMTINQETWELFKMKILAFFNEKFLYVDIAKKGFNIFDYNDII